MASDKELLQETHDAVIINTATLKNFIKHQEKLNDYFHNKHKDHDITIHGDKDSIGFKGEIDRIKQRNIIVNSLTSIAIVAWIGNAVKHFWPWN